MNDPTPDELLNAALEMQKAGRFREAEVNYRKILGSHPENAEVLHLLGTTARAAGRPGEAVQLIRRSLELKTGRAEIYYNLATALLDLPDLPAAIPAFEKAIELKPQFPQAWLNLAKALTLAGRTDDSLAAYDRAASLRPGHVPGLVAYGNALAACRRFEDSAAVLARAVAADPKSAEALCELGGALNRCRLYSEAVEIFRGVIALGARLDEAFNNLGVALIHTGNVEAAVEAYQKAIGQRANFPEAWSNLSGALKRCYRYDESIAASHKAIDLQPTYVKAHENLGLALLDTGNCHLAVDAFRRATELNPGDPVLRSNLIFAAQHDPDYSAVDLLTEQREWDSIHAAPLKAQIRPFENDRDVGRRIRIGYVSADLRTHPVGRFMLPLLSNHDRSKFEIFCYANVESPDAMTAQLRSLSDQWRDISGTTDADTAELIRRDSIDILIDLGMHSGQNRLPVFARKPAPIQVTWLAYPGGTGLSTMDYRLSDPYLDPPDSADHRYVEQTSRLPNTWWCYSPVEQQDFSPPPSGQRHPGPPVFGCLNNFSKVNDAVLAVWGRILKSVPGSTLLLFADPGSHRQRAIDRLGVDPARIEFLPFQPRPDYFLTYQRIDVALDTFPYAGGATTCDALWMGVPVVTLIGKTAVGRGGLSILSNIGLCDLAAETVDQYVTTAVDLAADPGRLARLRAGLPEMMLKSPLTDGKKFAGDIEAAFGRMWNNWCENVDPRNFSE